jgi:hypothetical protein
LREAPVPLAPQRRTPGAYYLWMIKPAMGVGYPPDSCMRFLRGAPRVYDTTQNFLENLNRGSLDHIFCSVIEGVGFYDWLDHVAGLSGCSGGLRKQPLASVFHLERARGRFPVRLKPDVGCTFIS